MPTDGVRLDPVVPAPVLVTSPGMPTRVAIAAVTPVHGVSVLASGLCSSRCQYRR